MNMQNDVRTVTQVNMTSKGQVLIPKEVRDALGLVPGQPVSVGINDRGEAVILPERGVESAEQRSARIGAAIARLRGTIDTGFATTDEYMDFIRPHRLDPE
ncbi:AbrB/MazE/SpoVT family DNA-binding domain-containing protein [Sphingomonas montana]|uniref:AbrB/MazE/SpoVT family DNA-binding domain-containing protein n=1 Tax=Sphingomonas montana TaxID=1843236 RepID=UPI00096EF7FB|nr:AbrB/MazE/SpoVT family DNA-binding domain-containing protein [Sphingomonas montana]